MKKFHLSTIIVLFFLSLIITACGGAAASALPPTETQPMLEPTAIPPEPTQTAAPTATPPPVPCMIAFDTDRDGNREIYIMGPDGKDPVNLSNDKGEDRNPAWSPDGSQIAFVSNRANQQGEGQFIYVMDANGNNVRQLSHEPNSDWPDWSQDGSQITYTNNEDIYVINTDGSGQGVNFTNSPQKDWQSTWSPDGSKIAWLSGSDGNWNIFVMYADGSNVRQITTDGKVSDLEWTVDNQIFTHWDNQKAGCFNCVMDADGSNVANAGGKGEIQRYLPFWTSDGNRVECVSGSMKSKDEEIFLVSEIYPDIFLNLTNNPANDRNPDWPANCGPGTEATTSDNPKPKDPKKIVIGYAGDDQWQPQRKDNFQKACDELGIECIYGEIPQLVAQGADAIVQNSNAITVNGLHQDILNARDKGIPVFILDTETNTDGAYSVTIDQRQWAKTSLVWLFEKIGGKGQIAYFDLAPFNRYTDTINDLLASYPGISVVDKRDGKYDSSKIKPEFSDFVKAYPELKAIWTSYDNTQTIWGMQENGIPYEKWPALVCEATLDGLTTWEKIQSVYPKFDCIAPANPDGIAHDAVYAAYYMVTGSKINESALGGEFGKSLYVDIPVVTKENLQQWLKQMKNNNMYTVDQWMTPEEIKEKWFLK